MYIKRRVCVFVSVSFISCPHIPRFLFKSLSPGSLNINNGRLFPMNNPYQMKEISKNRMLCLPFNLFYFDSFLLLTYLCLFCAGQVVCSSASWVQLNGIFLQSCAAGPWPLWLWQDWTWFIMPSTEPYGMPSVPTGGLTECPSPSKFWPETTSIQSAEPRWDKRALKPSKDIQKMLYALYK